MAKNYKKSISPAKSVKHKKSVRGKAHAPVERMKEPASVTSFMSKGFRR